MVESLKVLLLVSVSFSAVAWGQAGEPIADRQAVGDQRSFRPPAPLAVSAGDVETAIARGGEHLVNSQRADGAWGGPQWTGGVDSDPVPGSYRAFDIAVTAMCLESLLDVTQSDSVRRASENAFKFLIDRTDKVRRAGARDLPHVWAHCYCIQTFSKMFRQTTDESKKRLLKTAIQSHLQGLDRWQSIHGGWFYYGSGMAQPINPSCSFVNSAVLVALAEAREIGIDADPKMLGKAIKATKLMRQPNGTYLYSARIKSDLASGAAPINRPMGSLGRSQAGNAALRMWDDPKITNAVVRDWLDRLVSRHGWLDMGRKKPIPHESFAQVAGYFYYFGVYYGAVCIDQLPPPERPFYQHYLAKLIIDRQEKDGSWFDYPLYSYHKPYGTAFALLTLQRCRVNVLTKPASRIKLE